MKFYIFDNILLKNLTGYLNSFYSQFFPPQLTPEKIRYDQLMCLMRHPPLGRTTHQKGAPEGHTQGAFQFQ